MVKWSLFTAKNLQPHRSQTRVSIYQLKDNAAFRLFCGVNIVDGWHAPDHTKIEEFRNRISSETGRVLANTIAQRAAELGFADPREVDIDSTVQEANISYPSDAKLNEQISCKREKIVGLCEQENKKENRFKFWYRCQLSEKSCERVFFSFKKQIDRDKENDIQKASQSSKTTDATTGRVMRKLNRKASQSIALEYSPSIFSNQKRFMEIPSRCWPFREDKFLENWENIIFSRQRIGMYKKRKSRQRIRIWESISTGANKRKFSFCASLRLHRNDRQGKSNPFNKGILSFILLLN